jgi:Peptidase family M20/M25/M40
MGMPSGAMHDAQVMVRLAETGMIFIPSRGGRSHCPEEYSEPGQVEQGTNVLLDAIGVLAGQAPPQPHYSCCSGGAVQDRSAVGLKLPLSHAWKHLDPGSVPGEREAFARPQQPITWSAVILSQDHDFLATIELHKIPGRRPQKGVIDDDPRKSILPSGRLGAQVNFLWTHGCLDVIPYCEIIVDVNIQGISLDGQ